MCLSASLSISFKARCQVTSAPNPAIKSTPISQELLGDMRRDNKNGQSLGKVFDPADCPRAVISACRNSSLHCQQQLRRCPCGSRGASAAWRDQDPIRHPDSKLLSLLNPSQLPLGLFQKAWMVLNNKVKPLSHLVAFHSLFFLNSPSMKTSAAATASFSRTRFGSIQGDALFMVSMCSTNIELSQGKDPQWLPDSIQHSNVSMNQSTKQ